MRLRIFVFSERAEESAQVMLIAASSETHLRILAEFFHFSKPTWEVGSPTLQNVGVQHRSSDDGGIHDDEERVRDDDRLVFVHDAVHEPEDVGEREEDPGRERYAGATLRGVQPDCLRQEREGREDADRVHQTVEEARARAARGKWLETAGDERARAQVVEAEHIVYLYHITIDGEDRDVCEGSAFFCPRGSEHRVTGGTGGTTFLEIAFGDFDEGDIERLEDRYGRA